MHKLKIDRTKTGILAITLWVTGIVLPVDAQSRAPAPDAEYLQTSAAFLQSNPEQIAETAPTVPTADDPSLRRIVRAFDPQLDVVRAPDGFGKGRVWHVGADRPYKKPSDVVRLLHDGDVVEIDAGRYACDTGVKWSANYLTLVGIGGRATMDATNCEITGDKGIWNPQGTGLLVANIDFIGASGPSGNDAGIRYDGSGYLYITSSHFYNNQNGILATPTRPASADIVIDQCEFAYNGVDGGRTHNIYISSSESTAPHSFVIRFSYSHHAHVGHEVKTRALTNYILYNRIADEADGDSSYDIDVPQGGLTYIIGNVIQHSVHAENSAMVSYSAEDQHNPVQELYVVNNTFVSELGQRSVAVNLYDNRLAVAKMMNNLVVGVSPGNLVGIAPAKMSLANNVLATAPAFYDVSRREYHLTASSPAIHAGMDPGRAHEFLLAPTYEFAYPAMAAPRPRAASLDAGAYQYSASQVIAPPPAVTLTSDSPVDYDHFANLNWNATDTVYCMATGDWSGPRSARGNYRTDPLTSGKVYSISCAGPGGVSSSSASVSVNQSPAAAALGQYEWHEIPNSALHSVCASELKDASGTEDIIGTGPNCESKGNGATGVYVPRTRSWYLIGGAGGRNYYGNEVYGFNLATSKPELVTLPDHISESSEYAPDDPYNSKVHLPGCDGTLHSKTGTIVPAPSQVSGTAAWDPQINQIVVGPGAFRAGSLGCTVHDEAGQMTTSIWGFGAPDSSRLPASSAAAWHLLAAANNAFGSVTTPLWFLDPATGLIYIAGNRNYADRGGFLIDTTQHPIKSVLVNSSWPYGAEITGSSAIDTDRHYAMIVGNHSIAMWNLNGLSLARYSASKPFSREVGWKINGSVDLLNDEHHPGLTYNAKLKAFVAWTGSSTVYFLFPNYSTKTISIVAKTDIAEGPGETVNDLDGKFTYIPEDDAYLAFIDMSRNLFFLEPSRAMPSAESK